MEENNKKIDDEQLEDVNGGTFDTNKYSEETYNSCGINTNYHFFEKDEFWVWCNATGSWKSITYDQANEMVWLTGKYKISFGKITWEKYEQLKWELVNKPENFYKN